MLKRRTVIQASLAGGLLAGLAGLAEIGKLRTALGPTDGAGWRPIDWPFPRDGWPPGRAWRGHDLEVYVRPKLGFCGNCDTGVVSDDEVDRVTDIDLLDEKFTPLKEGHRVRITDLLGRARLYSLKMKDGKTRTAEGLAVSFKCDLIVAIIVGKVDDEPTAKFAHAFLESNKVQIWVNQQLEGR
jgi:hypothetical protein